MSTARTEHAALSVEVLRMTGAGLCSWWKEFPCAAVWHGRALVPHCSAISFSCPRRCILVKVPPGGDGLKESWPKCSAPSSRSRWKARLRAQDASERRSAALSSDFHRKPRSMHQTALETLKVFGAALHKRHIGIMIQRDIPIAFKPILKKVFSNLFMNV